MSYFVGIVAGICIWAIVIALSYRYWERTWTRIGEPAELVSYLDVLRLPAWVVRTWVDRQPRLARRRRIATLQSLIRNSQKCTHPIILHRLRSELTMLETDCIDQVPQNREANVRTNGKSIVHPQHSKG